jgi:hypothetical protein
MSKTEIKFRKEKICLLQLSYAKEREKLNKSLPLNKISDVKVESSKRKQNERDNSIKNFKAKNAVYSPLSTPILSM